MKWLRKIIGRPSPAHAQAIASKGKPHRRQSCISSIFHSRSSSTSDRTSPPGSANAHAGPRQKKQRPPLKGEEYQDPDEYLEFLIHLNDPPTGSAEQTGEYTVPFIDVDDEVFIATQLERHQSSARRRLDRMSQFIPLRHHPQFCTERLSVPECDRLIVSPQS